MTTVTNKNGIEFDIDALATDVNGKADKDLINVSSNASVCIESWHDNNGNWYRIYSDGWCEQGGSFDNITSSYSTKNLLKEYLNSNYNLIVCLDSDVSGNQYSVATITSTSTFKVKYTGTSTGKIQWRACGYIR